MGIFRIIIFIGISFLVCCAAPEIKPAKYAAPAQGDFWQPDKKLSNKIRENEKLPNLSDNPEINYSKLTLPELIDIALKNNPNTRYAWANAKAAAANWGISKSDYYPSLDGSVAGYAGNIPASLGNNNYATTNAVLSYLIWDFGQRKATARSAKQALIAANWKHNQVIQDMLRDVPQAYHTHIADKANLQATLKDLKEAQTSLKATELRRQSGVGTIADVLQAKARLAKVKVNLAKDKGDVKISKANLANTVGWPANADFDINEINLDLPLNKITRDVNKLIEDSKKYRADINASLASVRSKEEDLKKAKRAYFPKLTGSGNLQWNATRDVRDTAYYGGLQMSVPIFYGFSLRNYVRKAEAELEATRAELLIMEEEITNQVWSSFYNFETSKEQYAASKTLLSSASESYEVSFARYKSGAADIVELLDAQRTLADARSQLINAKMSLFNSFAELIHAIGARLPGTTVNDYQFKVSETSLEKEKRDERK